MTLFKHALIGPVAALCHAHTPDAWVKLRIFAGMVRPTRGTRGVIVAQVAVWEVADPLEEAEQQLEADAARSGRFAHETAIGR